MSKLNITELDFENIKQNLINFLSSQSQFEGFDFQGSNLNVLVELLAYNTHYNAFYANMLSNEMFLETAALRNSVVKKAAMLGYTPKSVTASKAILNIQVTAPEETSSTITLDKYNRFSTNFDSVIYNYCTINSYTLYETSNGVYTSNNVYVYQGDPITHTYTVDTSSTDQQFILPNANTDVNTLDVKIKLDVNSSNTYTYTLVDNITTINSSANVYFLKEINDGKFEVIFGDGVLGRKLSDGNLVILSAVITEGDAPNGARTFTSIDEISGYANITVTTSTAAYGGTDRESIESIKFQAPKHYQTSNRAVSVRDYKHIMESHYNDAESITVWGGEDNSPPVYGKVFIAVKPKTGLNLTQSAKDFIVNTLIKPRRVISITPEIVDPDYYYLTVTSTVKYDSSKIKLSPNVIKANIKQAIVNFGTNNLSLFDKKFRYSKLSQVIDNVNVGILNNVTSVKMTKEMIPTLNTSSSYNFKFNNAIYHPFENYRYAVTSTSFVHPDENDVAKESCHFDDLNGILRIISSINGIETIVKNNIGIINYNTGEFVINQFSPVSITGDYIKITVVPATSDIVPVRNQILLIENEDVVVNMIDDTDIGVYVAGSSTLEGSSGGGSAGTGG